MAWSPENDVKKRKKPTEGWAGAEKLHKNVDEGSGSSWRRIKKKLCRVDASFCSRLHTGSNNVARIHYNFLIALRTRMGCAWL